MNFLHILARNCCSSPKVLEILKNAVEEYPELLRERMTLSEDLDMTPVEMTIRTSYDEGLMNFMLTQYLKNFICLTSSDKKKLLSHAKWLSKSGIYSTALIGEKLKERINNIPEILND